MKKYIGFNKNSGEVTIFLPRDREHHREELWNAFVDRFSYESASPDVLEEMNRFVSEWLERNSTPTRVS